MILSKLSSGNMLPFFKFKHEEAKQNKQTKLRERVCERQSSKAFDRFFDSATIWNISCQITDQLETRSNVSSVFWLVERPVKRQQVTRLFFSRQRQSCSIIFVEFYSATSQRCVGKMLLLSYAYHRPGRRLQVYDKLLSLALSNNFKVF